MFNDLYRYNCRKNSWTLVTSPNRCAPPGFGLCIRVAALCLLPSPLPLCHRLLMLVDVCDNGLSDSFMNPSRSPMPRSAHQAIMYKHFLFVYGGEFTSPNQEKFYHYKDLWRLDLVSNEWELLPLKKGPSARSGHRMALHKGRIILFGGYYDVGTDVKCAPCPAPCPLPQSCGFSPLLQHPRTQFPASGRYEAALRWFLAWLLAQRPRAWCSVWQSVKVLSPERVGLTTAWFDSCRCRYYNDLWVLDIDNLQWNPAGQPHGQSPSPRSGCQLAVHEDVMYLHGGYSKANPP